MVVCVAGNSAHGCNMHRQDTPQCCTTGNFLPDPNNSKSGMPTSLSVPAPPRPPGFSSAVARWAATGTRPLPGGPRTHNLAWTFNLEGVADMYASYETTSLWPLLQAPPQGLSLDFVRAEHSSLRWGGGDEASITACGHRVHLVRDAGHWVHTDNPQGLWQVLAPSFGAVAPAVGGARA